MKPKTLLDDSSAAENFQDIVIKMQTKQAELEAKIEGKQLNLNITVEIDKAPIINEWGWTNKDSPTKQQPQRNRAGLGYK